jgi:hypothetical protein
MSETAETEPSNFRRNVETVMFFGAISSAILSTLGLASVLARLVSWRDAWLMLLNLAENMPGWVLTTLRAISDGFHRVIEAYREVVYPFVEYVLSHVSIRLESWQIDAMFILSFSVLSASKVAFFGEKPDGRDKPIRAFVLRLVNWPIVFIHGVGIRVVDAIDSAIAFAVRRPSFRPFFRLYMWLNWPLDRFVIGTCCNAVVLSAVFLADWTYLVFHR